MILKGIIDEDFINYKEASMVLEFPKCSFKCDKDCGREVCQNSSLAKEKDIEVDAEKLIKRYLDNFITSAIIMQGLEPFDSYDELKDFIDLLRNKYKCNDTIIIYSGYDEIEIEEKVDELKSYKNIIIKFGRFVPDRNSVKDRILGIELSSDNQYAKKIS